MTPRLVFFYRAFVLSRFLTALTAGPKVFRRRNANAVATPRATGGMMRATKKVGVDLILSDASHSRRSSTLSTLKKTWPSAEKKSKATYPDEQNIVALQ